VKTMKRNKKEGPSQVQKNEKFYEVFCPGCGRLVKKIKLPGRTKKLAFQCKKCTSKFSLIFPGTEERDQGWPRGL